MMLSARNENDFGRLMNPTSATDIAATKPAARSTLEYIPTYQRFVVKEKNFERQYSHVYANRLEALKPALQTAAKAKWGVDLQDKLIDLRAGDEKVCIGTLFKEMKLRPSVLDDYADEHGIDDSMVLDKYTSEDDTVVIEDASGRMPLLCYQDELHIDQIATGIVVAIKGRFQSSGEFKVQDFCLPGLPPQPSRTPVSQPSYVLLTSGLQMGSTQSDPMLWHLLVDYVSGNLGGLQDQELASNICRVIVAGNSVCLPTMTSGSVSKRRGKENAATDGVREPMQKFDQILSRLSSAVNVDVMPGPSDPSNFALPQQPLHPCLLPSTSRYDSLNCVTNPYEATVGGITFLGHSGQPVADLKKSCNVAGGELGVLEKTLQWNHMAPTAPDTLACYPFYHDDPHVISQCPHVYFAGNQEKFDTKMVQGANGQQCRVVCIPSFAASGTVVLLNVATLECQPMTFSTSL